MNNITEGCLAVILNSEAGNNGKIVTVGKFIGHVPSWVGYDRWYIDIVVPGRFGFFGNTMQEVQLMRIDGYSPESEVISLYRSI